jgi:hypothetical protein
MISLKTPISVVPPPIGDKTFEAIEFKSIDYSVNYDNTSAIASAFIKGINRNLLLWEGPDYIASGQFTDIDTDKRVLALLGSDPTKTLADLLINIQPYKYIPPATPPLEVPITPAGGGEMQQLNPAKQ